MSDAAEAVRRILADAPTESAVAPTTPLDARVDPNHVEVWFDDHPVIAPAVTSPRLDRFRHDHAATTVNAQFIGDQHVSVQKLAVGLAAGDLPDIAVLSRGMAGPLAQGGRLADLDVLLPDHVLQDLRPNAREAGLYQGRLVALPADGYCTVLYYNTIKLPEGPPADWAAWRAAAQRLRSSDTTFYPVAHIPYPELAWSAGARLLDGSATDLDGPDALRALEFILSMRDEGLLHPRAMASEDWGLDLLLAERTAMTVASSSTLSRVKASGLPIGVAAIPGEHGPISALSDRVLVVFAENASVRRDAIAQMLDYLTGRLTMGPDAESRGSAPVRQSVAAQDPELAGVYAVARAKPLHPMWNAVEAELYRRLDQAYRWRDPAAATP